MPDVKASELGGRGARTRSASAGQGMCIVNETRRGEVLHSSMQGICSCGSIQRSLPFAAAASSSLPPLLQKRVSVIIEERCLTLAQLWFSERGQAAGRPLLFSAGLHLAAAQLVSQHHPTPSRRHRPVLPIFDWRHIALHHRPDKLPRSPRLEASPTSPCPVHALISTRIRAHYLRPDCIVGGDP